MTTYHLNPESGEVNTCFATINCRFGGDSGVENHFPSKKDAHAAYDEMMQPNLFSSLKKPKVQPDLSKYSPEFIEAQNRVDEAEAEYERIYKEYYKRLDAENENFSGTDEWFDMIQARKNAKYAMFAARKARTVVMPEELRQKEEDNIRRENEAKEQKRQEWSKKNNYGGAFNYHPDVTFKSRDKYARVITSFSGLSKKEIEDRVAEKMSSQGMTETEAYRSVWSEAGLRNDKPIVAIDLETAFMTDNGVDTGAYSSIIEVGYIKIMPDGSCTKKSYLCGVPENLKYVNGTGAEDIHHISPEMVEGKTPFVDDMDRQTELLEDLRGSVLVAHNANFEVGNFKHNLRGFAQAYSTGEVEVLDTRDVCSYYIPEAADNSNNSFVEVTGGKYEGAHRAFEDAAMTLNSLFRSKNMPEVDTDSL